MTVDKQSFGARLKLLRKSKMLSLTELSRISGVSSPYLSQIENDKFIPSITILRNLAVALNVNLYDLALESGVYTEEDLRSLHRTARKNFLTDEEFTFELYTSLYHIQLEQFVNDPQKNFYIAGHKLTRDEMLALIALFESKEKNYPTMEEIKTTYKKMK
ncbi:helix-turn-helix domain-containing protein [Saccharococcus sp. Marseille-Q5394]|uniref:helix-turn-helix domain-containing protein n=1 Tax=Saccharococcus sp. Marseille-Q5394 TaxID=2972778 RepID=UPI0021C883F2|nr:helix-turn-helix transcriptional regulator [Saccharococcus sp. Marseille-Q5394]